MLSVPLIYSRLRVVTGNNIQSSLVKQHLKGKLAFLGSVTGLKWYLWWFWRVGRFYAVRSSWKEHIEMNFSLAYLGDENRTYFTKNTSWCDIQNTYVRVTEQLTLVVHCIRHKLRYDNRIGDERMCDLVREVWNPWLILVFKSWLCDGRMDVCFWLCACPTAIVLFLMQQKLEKSVTSKKGEKVPIREKRLCGCVILLKEINS